MKALNKYAPIKSKRVKHDTQADWFNDDIKEAIKSRNLNRKRKYWRDYKYWRNQSIHIIRKSKQLFANVISENKDSSYLWKHVKDLSSQTNESNLADELIIGNTVYKSHNDIVDRINNFMADIRDRIVIGKVDSREINTNLNKLSQFANSLIPNNVYFKIQIMKLSDLITCKKTLDPTKATGLDGISPKILKSAADVVGPYLLQSISNGQFSDILRMAKHKPIHKSGPKTDLFNYRPI